MVRKMRDEKYEAVRHTVRTRIDADHRRIQDMIDVRDRYDGDWVVPIPDIEGKDDLPAPVPYLMADAIDQTSMRAGSVMPFVEFPAVARSDGRTPENNRDYAAIRRRAAYARWDYSAVDLLLYRSFRHLTGYGSNALGVVPDFADKRARYVARDPLTAYPEPRDPEDVRPPKNAAFVYGKSRSWLIEQYPESRFLLDKFTPPSGTDDTWEVFEWVDAEEIIVGILGPRHPELYRAGYPAGNAPTLNMPLRRWENRAGICTYYVPFRVTLSKVMSQVAKMVPLSDLWAKLMALDVVAAEKAIFTDKYALGIEGRTPAIVSGDGTWSDGRTGQINVLENVKSLGALNDGPGPAAQPVIDRLERAIRINTGAIPQFGGETPGSLRTGRAIDALSSFAIDPRIQELHTIMRYALKATNEIAMAVEEGYWPSKKFYVFSGWQTDRGVVEYVPSKHFQTAEGGRNNAVTYAIAGADLGQTNVAVGQLVGSGLMSKGTGRRLHPLIPDSDLEDQAIDAERLKDAIMVGYAQQTAGGQVTLANAAKTAQRLRDGEDSLDAVVAADEDAREEQRRQMEEAAAAQGAGGEGAPPPVGPGGLQPASPAEQAAAATTAAPMLSAVPPVTTGQDRLRQLAAALRARA